MNIEVVEFYPQECSEDKRFLTGTLRVKLLDLGIEILGIYVSKSNDSYRFTLPGRKGSRSHSGETVWYPFIAFEDRNKQSELIAAIRKQGPAFIEKRLADTENPLVLPQKKEDFLDQRLLEKFSYQKAKDLLSESQSLYRNTEVAPPSQKDHSEPPKQELPKTPVRSTMKAKVFQDLPPRKTSEKSRAIAKTKRKDTKR